MARKNEAPPAIQSGPLIVSRTFPASRELVFRAWSSADHLKQWFCPAHYSVPEAHVEFRAGGAFHICMRSPEGRDHWSKGHFVEVTPFARLVIDLNAIEGQRSLFRAYTVVTFSDEGGDTRLEVTQIYTLFDARAEPMIKGAPSGWRETLDRLEREVERIKQSSLSSRRSVVHSTFCIERTYKVSRAQVFQALTDVAAKSKWFSGGQGYTPLAREMDVRPGGRELLKGRWDNGVISTFDAIYHDVVPDERIVYSYEMHLDARKISVSLTTFELKHVDGGTRLVMTEQGAFLDGHDDAGSRERGSNFLLDALGNSLHAQA